jgi:hypothetical protein
MSVADLKRMLAHATRFGSIGPLQVSRLFPDRLVMCVFDCGGAAKALVPIADKFEEFASALSGMDGDGLAYDQPTLSRQLERLRSASAHASAGRLSHRGTVSAALVGSLSQSFKRVSRV